MELNNKLVTFHFIIVFYRVLIFNIKTSREGNYIILLNINFQNLFLFFITFKYFLSSTLLAFHTYSSRLVSSINYTYKADQPVRVTTADPKILRPSISAHNLNMNFTRSPQARLSPQEITGAASNYEAFDAAVADEPQSTSSRPLLLAHALAL